MKNLKSFTKYLTEDKDRFIKKNRNLTDDQKNEVIKFFKTNRQAEGKVDWHKSKTMTYDQFVDIMIQTKSGRKTKLKHQKIKGSKEGTDYVAVRMPTNLYLAYIPLNYETAQKFNTRELGVCSGPWCIGHSGDPYHWNDEVIQGMQVPVYVVNTHSKWVVMIKEGNRTYDVWTVENNPQLVRQGIPDFSVRKNLLSTKQKEMYDEIREEYYDEEEENPYIDVEDATIDYNLLVSDIEDAHTAWERSYDYFHDEAARIKHDTKSQHEAKLEMAQEIYNELEALHEKGEDLQQSFEDEEDEDETVDFDGEDGLNFDELKERIDAIEKKKDDAYDVVDALEDAIDEIDEIEAYEMEHSDIDWSEDPPSEDYIYDDVDIPSVYNSRYKDYFDVMEEYAGWGLSYNGSTVDEEIQTYVMEGYAQTAESVLADNDLYHPDYLNER